MAGLSTLVASYRKNLSPIPLACTGFDPVLVVPAIRINESELGMFKGGNWGGFRFKEQEPKQIFFVVAKNDTKQEESTQL